MPYRHRLQRTTAEMRNARTITDQSRTTTEPYSSAGQFNWIPNNSSARYALMRGAMELGAHENENEAEDGRAAERPGRPEVQVG